MNKSLHDAVALAACGAVFALLAPQNPTQDPKNPPPMPKPGASVTDQDPKHSDLAARSDRVLAAWLIIDNNNEVALSKIALERSQNADVKRFAQQMVDDHSAMVQKLHQFAPGVGGLDGMQDETMTPERKNPTNEPAPGQGTDPAHPANPADPTNATDPAHPRNDPQRRDVDRNDGMVDHVSLVRDLGRKCLESSKLMLNEKTDAEFDRCFMGMQLMMHQKAADTLEVFQRYASPNLRSALDSGLQTVRMHKDHAKTLMKALEDAQDVDRRTSQNK